MAEVGESDAQFGQAILEAAERGGGARVYDRRLGAVNPIRAPIPQVIVFAELSATIVNGLSAMNVTLPLIELQVVFCPFPGVKIVHSPFSRNAAGFSLKRIGNAKAANTIIIAITPISTPAILLNH